MALSPVLELRERLGKVFDLQAAASVLHWDMEVNMPPKGMAARGLQLSTLSALAHRMFTGREMGELLALLEGDPALDAGDRKLVDETLYDYRRATKLPEAFVEKFALEQSKAYECWVEARNKSNFALFRPHLETMITLCREKAEYMGYADSPYDALLEEYERGMTAARIREIFGPLAKRQSALVERIMASPNQPEVAWLDQEWDEQRQWDFTLRVLQDTGYDFDAGRQDKSVHPFSTSFGIGDVRVTTRVYRDELFTALTGSLHEGGHALYEQGFDPADARTCLAGAPSLGMHESQSRMWENMIGRSRPFWEHYLPLLREAFPGQLDGVAVDQLHRAINAVKPDFIRVEADECTYNLHIVLRFEIEVALIEGELAVDDIPAAWNAKVKQYLGLDAPDDARGCLQDIHWSHGSFGYFPTYALGNLYAAQLFEVIERDVPGLWEGVRRADFSGLLAWLREHVHRHGRRKTAREILVDATGAEPGSEAYVRYLEKKYGELYGI